MANFYERTYQAAMDGYECGVQQADLDFRRAQADGDVGAAAEASQTRAALLLQAERYHRQAVQHAATLQPAPGASKFGLSEKEMEIARTLSPGARDLSDEDRQRIYADNKAKYQHARATGAYRDDQGSVKR